MKSNTTLRTVDPTRKSLTRRELLRLGMAAAGSLALPFLAGCQPADPAIAPGPTPDDNFSQPKVIRSVKHVLQTTLLIKMQPPPSTFKADADSPPVKKLRMYGTPRKGTTADPTDDRQWEWSFPGPTLQVDPGDHIKLSLLNYLPTLLDDEAGVCDPAIYPTPGSAPSTTATPAFNNDVFPNCFSESNVTNLHYHGLHVKQGLGGDDVLLAIWPHGQSRASTKHEEHGMTVEIGGYDYNFEIPEDHPQGTFWYHPHKHGATDLQVANGLAGAIIVNDRLNEEPEFRDQPPVEQVLVIQKILANLNFPPGTKSGIPFDGTLTINGNSQPTITMQAGEVQRWRLINATGAAASAFELAFTGAGAPAMHIIAVDGNFLDQSHWDKNTPTEALFLAPGNRADVLVYAPSKGQFDLKARSITRNQRDLQTAATPTPIPPSESSPFLAEGFLTVKVAGQMTPQMKLPAKLPSLPHNLRPFGPDEIDAGCRTLIFGLKSGERGGAKTGNAPQWVINDKKFDPLRVDQRMVKGTSETWTLVNTTPVAHPFHIHLNPFLIQKFTDPEQKDPDFQNPRTTGDNPEGQWQDTIIIPAQVDGTPGQVVIRHRFLDFTGKFVLHCHILGHEDRGMMQLLEVVESAAEVTPETAADACAAPIP